MDTQQKCSDVYPYVKSLVLRNMDAAFPMGNYTLHSDYENDYVWAKRKTYNGLYIDDVIWEFSEKVVDDEQVCDIHARS